MSQEGKSDLIQSYQDEIQWTLDKYKNQDTFYPFVGEVKKYLSNSQAYVGGVKELLGQSGRDDWMADFERFEAKVSQYDAYVTEHILPRTRQTPNEPIALYQLNLKSKQVSSIEGVSQLYNSASDRLEGIIRANNLVTLPKKRLKIRFAGDAESKAAPVTTPDTAAAD